MRNVDPQDRPIWFRATHEQITASIAKAAADSHPSSLPKVDPCAAATQELILYREAAQRIAAGFENKEPGFYGRILREATASAQKSQDPESVAVISGMVNGHLRQAESMARAAGLLVDRLGFFIANSEGKVALREDERTGILSFVADAAEYRQHLVVLSGFVGAENWGDFKVGTRTLPTYIWPLISKDDGMIFYPVDPYPDVEEGPEGDWDSDSDKGKDGESPVLVDAARNPDDEWDSDDCYLSCSSE